MADFRPPSLTFEDLNDASGSRKVIMHTANNNPKVSQNISESVHKTENVCPISQNPKIQKLMIHLPDHQHVIFNEPNDQQNVRRGSIPTETMFTKWMEANQNFTEARELTYTQFPTKFVWNSSKKERTKRKQSQVIGRIPPIHPAAGEIYYLRMLMKFVK